MTPREKAIAAADARVPSGVVVAAANFVGSELSDRDTVLMWDGDGYASPFAAPWVVADIRRNELGFSTLADQRADVALLQRHGANADKIGAVHRQRPSSFRDAIRRLASLRRRYLNNIDKLAGRHNQPPDQHLPIADAAQIV